jgi:hypothetical protein
MKFRYSTGQDVPLGNHVTCRDRPASAATWCSLPYAAALAGYLRAMSGGRSSPIDSPRLGGRGANFAVLP